LQDILDNEEVKLDNMFIASLVSDILHGLQYLHDSPLRFHGNLKTSNCLVDSRWVVKVADFGLHEFKKGAEGEWDSGEGCGGLLKRLIKDDPTPIKHRAYDDDVPCKCTGKFGFRELFGAAGEMSATVNGTSSKTIRQNIGLFCHVFQTLAD